MSIFAKINQVTIKGEYITPSIIDVEVIIEEEEFKV